MTTRYVNVTVDVDVEMSDFDDQDLIDELESRKYFVSPTKGWAPPLEDLTYEEITAILDRFQMSLPGTIGYEIYEKLRKR
jgi:hypothetical protein